MCSQGWGHCPYIFCCSNRFKKVCPLTCREEVPSSWASSMSPAQEELLAGGRSHRLLLRQFLPKLPNYIPISGRDINSIHVVLTQLLRRGSPTTKNYWRGNKRWILRHSKIIHLFTYCIFNYISLRYWPNAKNKKQKKPSFKQSDYLQRCWCQAVWQERC